VERTISFPDYPNSSIIFETDVRATTQAVWETDLRISGSYDGPTDVVSVRAYELTWTIENGTLIESGTATLVLSSGESLRSTWSSRITSEGQDFRGVPEAGETVRVTVSPFRIDADSMSYDWEGSVAAANR
jgi:hypothetical protein